MAKVKDYPLYETTVFEDFRIMTENVAKKYPDDPAFSYKEKPSDEKTVVLTYSQVRDEQRDYGTGLVDLGCREKHCAIIGAGSVGWALTYFSLMSIGAVSVPLDKEWPAKDLAAAVNRAHCSYVFYSSEVADKIDVLREECPDIKNFVCMWGTPVQGDLCRVYLTGKGHDLYTAGDNTYYDYPLDPDKMASIVFTSGTTGKGKGVMLSQTNICTDMTQGMYNFEVTRKTLCALPLHHTFGSTANLVGHFAQGSEIYFSNGLRYISKEMQEQQPTPLVLVPLFLEKIHKKIWSTARKTGKEKLLRAMMKVSNGLRKVGVDARRKMFASVLSAVGGKVEFVICGGAPLNQELVYTFDAIGITIINGYGITECAPLVSVNRNKKCKPGSVGAPNIGELIQIREPNEEGEGEICVKGSNVMLGYYEEPEATAAVFDEEGYFRTGDIGKVDEEGWLYITGRLKNLIILANGKNVYPEEIEQDIAAIPGVEEVIVYAGESKSDASKEVIVAEIFPDYEYTQEMGIEDVQKYFGDHVAEINRNVPSYKMVGLVKIRTTEFPKNTTRKITRFAIDKTID